MQIRNSVEADNNQLSAIFKYNLSCGEAYADWYAKKCRPSATTVVAEQQGRIISVIELTPYSMMINNLPTSTGYISTVTTLPEFRGNGYARTLISKTIAAMYDAGKTLCFAVPPSYRMFDKFGFRLTHMYKQYAIEMKNIPNYSIRGSVERIIPNEVTTATLAGIYEKYTADKNAYVIRSAKNWITIIDDLKTNFGGHIALVKNSAGEPCGYLMYIINGRQMHIYETAYTDHSAYASVMSYIRSHITQVDKVFIKAPADDLSFLDFCDNRTAVGMYPFVSSRITNAAAALTCAVQAEKFDETLTLQLVDMIEKRNNAVFKIENGSVTVTDDTAEPDVMCDIGTLTQLYLGFLSPAEAVKMSLLCGNDKKLNGLFKKKNNYINMLIV